MKLRTLLTAAALAGLLAGCDTLMEQQPEPPAAPVFFENAYAARQDGKFNLPAIPVDQIPEAYRRQIVDYETAEAPGTIIVDPRRGVLYLVQPEGKAIRYGISVGRDGFGWSGTSVVARKARWPTWTPPAEMIERQPSLEKWREGQPGGPTNPLGARALYLYINGQDHGFRIHGTPEWRTIGKRASSGCFRMIQQDVLDLYERVPNGTKVIVLTPEGEVPTKLTLPPPAPRKPRPEPKPEVTPAAAEAVTPAEVETAPLPDATTTDAPAPDATAPDASAPETAAPAAESEPAPEAPSATPEPTAPEAPVEPTPEPEEPAPATPPVTPPAQ